MQSGYTALLAQERGECRGEYLATVHKLATVTNATAHGPCPYVCVCTYAKTLSVSASVIQAADRLIVWAC